VIEQTAESHDQVMAHTHALTFFVAKGMLDAGSGLEVPFSPPSFQAISRTIDTVRSDAGHLFAAIQKENPFAADARQHLIDTLAAIHRDLEHVQDDPSAQDTERLSIPALGDRSPELRETRDHIDVLDRQIVDLLARRAELALRAAKAKAELGHPVLDTTRESTMLEARRGWAELAELDPRGVEEVFRAIIRLSRRGQARR
jgi:prephenate dehydrogenase